MAKYDLIVFGASGFTGQYVVLDLAKRSKEPNANFTFAIAGRNKEKLQNVVENLVKAEIPSIEDIPIILADVNDETSLLEMCKQTKVLMNCTGPYRYYGAQTVKACIDAGAHYVDITGEPDFIERSMFTYHEDAKKKGVVVVSACGWDSIPAEMGTVFTTEQFPKEGAPSSVEAFIDIQNGSCGHYTTYECIVLGVSSANLLKDLRKKMEKVNVPYVGPKLKKRSIGYNKILKKYFVQFMGSDASIVRNSQRQLMRNKETYPDVKPVQFGVYLTSTLGGLIGQMIFAVILMSLVHFEFGRKLLLKYPSLFTFGAFTHEGPSREDMKKTTFTHHFFAKGYKNKAEGKPDWQVVTRVDGPEPGYVATPIFLVESALTILRGEVTLRGVLTSATAFRSTTLIPSLQKRGIKFSVVSAGPLSEK